MYLIAIENGVDIGQVHGQEEVGGNWAHEGLEVLLKIQSDMHKNIYFILNAFHLIGQHFEELFNSPNGPLNRNSLPGHPPNHNPKMKCMDRKAKISNFVFQLFCDFIVYLRSIDSIKNISTK